MSEPHFADAPLVLGIAMALLTLSSAATAQDEHAQRDGTRTTTRVTQPSDAQAHYMLGRARSLAGDPQRAIPELREAIRLSPSNADCRAELGNAYYTIGAIQAAAGAYRAALQLQHDHTTETAKLWISRARLDELERSMRADGGTRLRRSNVLTDVVVGICEAVLQLAWR